MADYVVHCQEDEDMRKALCGEHRGVNPWTTENHMLLRAGNVLAKRFNDNFRDGRKYEDSGSISMRFCKACLDHPDLELLALGEV